VTLSHQRIYRYRENIAAVCIAERLFNMRSRLVVPS